ncbi:MAG: hypothetical protein ACRDJC_20970, partial [Thermomicrobiales bacterium]
AFAMPVAALAAIAGLLWPPLGEAIAAPAVVAASALIGIVDLLGAPQGYIGVGVPTRASALIFAVTGWLLLFLLSGDLAGVVRRAMMASAPASLPAAALCILGREDPANALAADADDSEE